MPISAPKFFFSYAREDAAFALKLAKELRDTEANVWLDQLDIVAGQRWDEAVEEALRICQGVLVVLTPESVASNNVMDEVSYALEEHKLVVPVLHKPCAIPLRLRRLQYVDFTIDELKGVEALRKALELQRSRAPHTSAEREGIAEERGSRAGDDARPRPREERPPEREAGRAHRAGRGRALFWSVGVVVLGLWPIVLGGKSDDPFLVNPMIIAGGLLAMAFAKPIEPQVALAFSVVPYVLNLFGMALFLRGNYLTSYYLASSELIIGLVAFAASLFLVRVICSRRALSRP
jgi:hypothetical protein